VPINQDFKNIFNIQFTLFFDKIILAAGFITIDIIKFDEWLHKLYGNYEDYGKNMQDVIIEHYGIEGDKLIDKLI